MTDYRTEAEKNVAARFPKTVAGHQMTVLHNDNLYKHLRFANPKYGRMYSFDLITWPGHLTITGDICDAYVFTRLTDMLQFFRDHEVNPMYWSEKLYGDLRRVHTYDQDLFEQQVKAYVVEAIREGDAPPGLGREVTSEIFEWGDISHEVGARKELDDFSYKGWTFDDTSDWEFRDWNHGFLRACHAIVWGIARYDRLTGYGLTDLIAAKAVA